MPSYSIFSCRAMRKDHSWYLGRKTKHIPSLPKFFKSEIDQFPFNADAVPAVNFLFYDRNQFLNIGRRGRAKIYNEPCMLG